MAGVRIDEDLSKLIGEKAERHGYADASTYLRDLIRRDEAGAEWLRRELQAGVESGVSPYTIEEAVEAGFEQARRSCG